MITGIIVLIISFVLTIFGFLNLSNTAENSFDSVTNYGFETNTNDIKNMTNGMFGGFGLFALGGITSTIGFIMTAIGVALIITAHKREIAAYTTQQVMPVAQEGIEKMAPTIGNAAETIAKSIKEGLKDEEK